MKALTNQEKRTVQIGIIVLITYLVLFYGVRGWRSLERERSDYVGLMHDAQRLQQEIRRYEKKALLVQGYKQTYHLDLSKLSNVTLVAEASAAIQKAASAGGVQLGPLRESSARTSVRELTSIQLEGSGPIPAVLGFLHRIQTLGYPLILDSIQLNAESNKPGVVKLTVTVVILDYEQWKVTEVHRA